jgi:hypothetical protein
MALGAGQAGKQPQKPFLGYWHGIGLAHQAKSPSVAAKWVERGCRFKRRSDKEKTVASLRRQRFLFGGLGRNRTIDTRIFNANPKLKSTVFSTCCNLRKFRCAFLVQLLNVEKVRTVLKSILTIPLIRLPLVLENTMFSSQSPVFSAGFKAFVKHT